MLVGAGLIFTPTLVAIRVWAPSLGLLGLWIAKNALTAWRAAAALYYIELREWRVPAAPAPAPAERAGGGRGGRGDEAPLLVNE